MSEQCPLRAGPYVNEIPETCLQQCGGLMLSATVEQLGTRIDYWTKKNIGDCSHMDNVAQASPHLQGEDASPHRVYSIVDKCLDCQKNIGETDYAFDCPYN